MGIHCTQLRTRNWIATDMVPQAFRLGRQSIRHSTVQAVEVDHEEVFEASDQDMLRNDV